MKPWVLLRFEALSQYGMWGHRDAMSGVVYYMNDIEFKNHGEINKDQYIWFFDDEATCDKFKNWALERWPVINLLKLKSQEAVYREVGPQRKAVFTDKGLIPQ